MCSLIGYNKYAVIIQDAHIKHGKEFEIIRSVYIYYSFFFYSLICMMSEGISIIWSTQAHIQPSVYEMQSIRRKMT